LIAGNESPQAGCEMTPTTAITATNCDVKYLIEIELCEPNLLLLCDSNIYDTFEAVGEATCVIYFVNQLS